MIKAHWVRLALFALGGAILALGVSLLATKQYEGFVQILIDQKQQDPVATTDPAYDVVRDLTSYSRSRSIVTQVEQLTGYDVLRRAGEASVNTLGVPPAKMEEFAPVNLRNNISVEAEQGSDIITLRVRMSDPEYARETAGQIYDAFEDQNVENARVMAERATQYLEGKATDVHNQLLQVDKAMEEIRTKYNAPDLASKIQSELNGLAIMRQARDAAKIEHQGSIQRVAVLADLLNKTPKEIDASTSETQNPVVTSLEQALAEARAERAQLLERNLPDSERVRTIDSRIRQLETDLRATKERLRGPSTRTPNPNYMSLSQSLSEARAAMAGLEARVAQADTELASSEQRIAVLPAAQSDLTGLLRRQAILEQIYQTYGRQLESLRLTQQGRLAPTRLVTAASVLPQPVSPKIPINIVIGTLVGLLIGVLSMFGAEAKKQPVRTLAQLNALSFHPVYRVIPELRTPFKGLERPPHESYESLLVNILRSGKKPYRIGFVGVTKDSGASTAALNLAIAAQRHGLATVVVSNDPKSSVKRYLWRSGAVPQGPVVRVSSNIEWIPEDDGKIMAAGEKGDKLSDAMGVPEKDLTIFDFEPAAESAEFALLAASLDEVVMLVRANRARTVEFLSAQQALRDAGCKQVTVVFCRSGDLELSTDLVTSEAEPLAS